MKTKREYMNLYLFEIKTLSKHFEEMAKQGWMLSSIGMLNITYQECEPQDVHFFIDIYHKGGYLNPRIIPSDEESYGDFISEYGYELVTRTANFQVFMTHQEDMIPIHDDQEEMKKAQCKTILKYEIFNHLYILIFIPLFSMNFMNLSLYTYTSDLIILFHILLPFALLLVLYRVHPTIKWLILKDKYNISVTKMMKRNTFLNRLNILILICFISSFIIASETSMIPPFLTLVISALVFLLLDPFLARFIKKYHSVFALIICLYVGMLINVNFFIFSIPMEPSNQAEGELTYHDLRKDLPDVVERDFTNKDSFLLKQERYSEYYQDNQNQTRDFEDDISFHYELYTIKVSFMQDYLQDIALDDRYTLSTTGNTMNEKTSWKLYNGSYDQCLMWDNYILYLSIYDTGHDNFTSVSNEQITTIIEQF